MMATMKRAMLALGFLVAAMAPACALETLDTPSFTITVDVRCEEGNVTCDDVRYVGTSKKTGKAIRLTGRTRHTTCADGVTPCRFLGYEFKNGATVYFLSDGGELVVERRGKTLLREQGEWK
jgi:hypothetical protein